MLSKYSNIQVGASMQHGHFLGISLKTPRIFCLEFSVASDTSYNITVHILLWRICRIPGIPGALAELLITPMDPLPGDHFLTLCTLC
jgi:hypothetical protein